jgi:hypothetical protein
MPPEYSIGRLTCAIASRLDAVPPGNSIVSLTCLFACEAGAVVVG